MDYRALLTVPLAALALTASGDDKLRQPAGWFVSTSFAADGATHEAGVAPETENAGQRALAVKALGERKTYEIGGIGQILEGYGGQRVRFSAQVKTAGVDRWAGLVVASSVAMIHLLPASSGFDAEATAPRGVAGCPEWCDVSVVADIPAGRYSVANIGLALVGSGQVWARNFKLETVSRDVPVTAQRFGVEAAAALTALQKEAKERLRKSPPTPPQNLALQ
jgi:hypothetical protein